LGYRCSHRMKKFDAWSNVTQCRLKDTRRFGDTCTTSTSHPQKTVTVTVTSSESQTSLTAWRLHKIKYFIIYFGWFSGVFTWRLFQSLHRASCSSFN
jgi:hypothetical protein